MASVVINYCSNERIFIAALLTECLEFSEDIVVSYGSHLYDGQPEDHDHIQAIAQKYPTVKFVEYKVDTSLDLQQQQGVQSRPTAYWHNLARWTGINALQPSASWIFLIDADEIPEGRLVRDWLATSFNPIRSLSINSCYKIATYWYFKEATNRAHTLEDSILLIHRSKLTPETIFGDGERDHTILSSQCALYRQVKDKDNRVMWNHYSWVRSRGGLLHKIKNWGHSNEFVDPHRIISYIFRDDQVNDIIHGYSYDKVPNRHNIDV
jgi:hypothetical protein